MIHTLPNTEVVKASTEDSSSTQVQVCCVRFKKLTELPDYQVADLMQNIYLPDHFRCAFSGDPVRQDVQG